MSYWMVATFQSLPERSDSGLAVVRSLGTPTRRTLVSSSAEDADVAEESGSASASNGSDAGDGEDSSASAVHLFPPVSDVAVSLGGAWSQGRNICCRQGNRGR